MKTAIITRTQLINDRVYKTGDEVNVVRSNKRFCLVRTPEGDKQIYTADLTSFKTIPTKASIKRQSWNETHYEVSVFISKLRKLPEWVIKDKKFNGFKCLYWLAEQLTNEFENKHKGLVWGVELEFFETIESFCKERL